MFSRLLTVIVVLAAIIGVLGFIKYSQIQKQIAQFSQPRPATLVDVVEVRKRQWRPTLNAVGSVRATQGVEVTAEVAGQVKQILFESGAKVRKGQPLVQLDDEVDRADLAGLKAGRHLADIQLKRNRSLLRDRAVAKSDVDELSARLDQASAQVAAKQAAIDKKLIRAPFAGELGIRQIDLGQYLSPGSSIVSLQALDQVYVDFNLPERYLAELEPGLRVEVHTAGHAERVFTGAIEVVSPAVTASSRNVPIRALLDNSDHALKPGMFARVTTLLDQEQVILTVPREAVSFNTYGDSVFVVLEQDGKIIVKRRNITTGRTREGEVEITDGLAAGDRIVAAGQLKLNNDQEVRINESAHISARTPVTEPDQLDQQHNETAGRTHASAS